MKKILFLFLLILTTSCGISEDCFKGNGAPTTLTFPLENFTKVKVYSGVGLVVKEGLEYEVKIETRDNIKDNLEINLEGDMLVVKDNSTCNITRDYGVTTVYITAPNLEEIHSKTEQDIKSDGVLSFPELRIYSIGEDRDGAGSGDFYLNVENDYLYFESNTVSNFYVDGLSNYMVVFFSWGNSRFYGENMHANIVDVFHRGSNDMILYPIESLTGTIYATGNVVLINNPINISVEQKFTGKIIQN